MKRDRFGNIRCEGYNREDFTFCPCVPARAKLIDPCKFLPDMKCPSCGGYGEIPKKSQAEKCS